MGRLVIGCKHCFEEIKETRGYLVNNKGLLQIPIPVHTAYTNHELYELFFENYKCPFCQNELTITPKIVEFANNFIDVKYHIVFKTNSIHIIYDSKEIEIKKDLDMNELILLSNNEFLPPVDELKLFLDVALDVDSSKWYFYIESEHVKKLPITTNIKK